MPELVWLFQFLIQMLNSLLSSLDIYWLIFCVWVGFLWLHWCPTVLSPQLEACRYLMHWLQWRDPSLQSIYMVKSGVSCKWVVLGAIENLVYTLVKKRNQVAWYLISGYPVLPRTIAVNSNPPNCNLFISCYMLSNIWRICSIMPFVCGFLLVVGFLFVFHFALPTK